MVLPSSLTRTVSSCTSLYGLHPFVHSFPTRRSSDLKFTAQRPGVYEFDTFGSDFDTVLYTQEGGCDGPESACNDDTPEDRKSTRLNSSHGYISYAVFCLKKKNTDYLTETADNIREKS